MNATDHPLPASAPSTPNAELDRELVVAHLFDAPRALVFNVWTDPRHVAEWWGPNGFATTVHEMDVRRGGVWRCVMHAPDGVDYVNQGRIHRSDRAGAAGVSAQLGRRG